jgi:hypothetical protein
MFGTYEGALISEYYLEPKLHDIIFIGDCEVYGNISPVTLWENHGISSYTRGGPQQLVWQSYYLLKDTLRYEKPSVVVFSVLAMQYNEPQREGYNRLNIDGMRLSKHKIAAAKASALEGESILSYVFPLFRYHDRWQDLKADDFRYFWRRDRVSINGYMMRADIKPVGIIPEGRRLHDYGFGEKCLRYLDMITELCRDNDIRLVLIKSPGVYPHWYTQWDMQMVSFAKDNDLIYINLLELSDEIGIDFNTDTYNAGLHLNVYGAEKLADYLGGVLKDFVPDRRQEPEYTAIWSEKVNTYNKLKRTQENEIKEMGSVITLTPGGLR